VKLTALHRPRSWIKGREGKGKAGKGEEGEGKEEPLN